MSRGVEREDAVRGLLSLKRGSVRLILTDLPSGETRAPFDRKPDLDAFWPAAWRALKPDGTVVVFCSSLPFALTVIASEVKSYRYDLVWHKSLATGQLNSKHRPLRAHEYILVFARRLGVWNPQKFEAGSPIHAATQAGHGQNYGGQSEARQSRAGATDRFPRSVLPFASVGTSAAERVHPQQKPVPLLRWLVRSYSDEGELVVDPYAGSGSTGRAARLEKRRFRGFDTSRFEAKPWGCAASFERSRAELGEPLKTQANSRDRR